MVKPNTSNGILKILSLISIFFVSIILLFSISFGLDSLQLSCSIGGPYLSSSTAIISGNVTNIGGSPKIAKVNITVNGVTNSVQSDTNGAFYSTFSNLPVGNYSLLGIANASNFNNASCSGTLQIFASQYSGACVSKTIYFTGTVIDSGSGNLITSGKVTSSIIGTSATGSGTINSAGHFAVYVTGCLYYSTSYVVSNLVVDNSGNEGWFSFIYIPS